MLLVVVAQHRFDPLVGRVSRFLRAGGLGRPALWRADLECRRDPAYWRESPWRGRRAEAGGAALLTLGHHLLDLLLWLGGAPVRGTAELSTSPEAAIDSEDTAAGVLALGAAATPATIAVTAAAGARWRPRLEALGTEAAIALDVGYPARLVRLDLASTAAERRWHESGEAGGTAVDEIGDAADAAPSYLDLHRRQADHFLARLRGRPGHPDAATGADAVAVLRAAEMLYRSRPSLP